MVSVRKISQQSETLYRQRIIRFLADNSGDWWNVQQIYEKLPKPSIHRLAIRKICDVLTDRGFVARRDAMNQRSSFEYKISPDGLEFNLKLQKFSSGEKYLLGIGD